MAGLLQQILGLLGLAKTPKRGRRHSATRRSGLVRCRQCLATIRPGAPRCPQCGTRIVDAPAKSPSMGKLRLTDIQKELLAAASDSENRTILVTPATESDAGEIKVGSLRKSGSEVLAAVNQLWEAGLVTPTDDHSFALTDAGQQAVDRL